MTIKQEDMEELLRAVANTLYSLISENKQYELTCRTYKDSIHELENLKDAYSKLLISSGKLGVENKQMKDDLVKIIDLLGRLKLDRGADFDAYLIARKY